VFLTRNSEYHVRGMVCFGVRDRRSGAFLPQHWALGQPLAHCFADGGGRLRAVALPIVGEALRFIVQGQTHCTSPVLGVEEREHLQLERGGGHTPIEALLCRQPPANARDTY
jgi:hypothetical protein